MTRVGHMRYQRQIETGKARPQALGVELDDL